MRSWILTGALALTSLGLSACGDLAEDGDDARRRVLTRTDLVGTWETACHASQTISGLYAITRYEFGPISGFAFVNELFRDAACQLPERTQRASGAYSLASDEIVEGTNPIDFRIDEASVTPQTDDAAKTLSREAHCGISDWEAGVGRSVKDASCGSFSLTGDARHRNVFDIRDEVLFLGLPELFAVPTDEPDRPTALDLSLPLAGR